MKTKYLIILLTLLISSSIYADSRFACQFLFINPSARDASFGLESGTAGLRSLSPTSMANNPAKLGAFQGVGYEFSAYDYACNSYNTSNLVFGVKGIGLSLPMFNAESKFGNTRLFGAQYATDENGNEMGLFQPKETEMTASLGFNLLQQFGYESRDSDSWLDNTDIYIGYSFNWIQSKLIPKMTGMTESSGKIHYNCFTSDLGMLASYDLPGYESSPHSFEFTFGITFENFLKEEMFYINEAQKDMLPYGVKFAASGTWSLDLNWLEDNIPQYYSSNFRKYTDKTIVVYGSFDHAQFGDIRKIDGFGVEVALLDIISYRIGHTLNHELETSGTSYSYGLNLNFHNRYQLMIDYLDMFESTEIYSPEKWNFSVAYKF